VKNTPHLTLQSLADLVGQDLSALSKLAVRMERKSEIDLHLQTKIERLKESLKFSANVKCQA